MSLDLQLGLITVGMAVLGGVVSAHGPRHLAWKIVYDFAFCLFGGYAIMLVVKQSAQSASASAKLSESISELSQSSHENTRLADLNSRLQERLLGLSKKTIEGVFGGGYPVLFVMANFDGNRKPGAMLLNSDKSNHQHRRREAGKPGETEESMLRKIHEQKGASIPLLTPGDFMPVPITFPYQARDYWAKISTRNGNVTETFSLVPANAEALGNGFQMKYKVVDEHGRLLTENGKSYDLSRHR